MVPVLSAHLKFLSLLLLKQLYQLCTPTLGTVLWRPILSVGRLLTHPGSLQREEGTGGQDVEGWAGEAEVLQAG